MILGQNTKLNINLKKKNESTILDLPLEWKVISVDMNKPKLCIEYRLN